MTDELKPCPFCGGEAHISASSDGYGVECWNRRCIDMQMDELPTEAEAIDAWNTRAERTCTLDGSHSINYGYAPVGTVWEWDLSCGHHIEMDDCPDYCPYCGAKVVDKS